MTTWESIKLLALYKSSLSRVLSEIELTHLRKMIIRSQAVKFALVPGAGKRSQGSERVFLDSIDSEPVIFVDIDGFKKPDIIADLTCSWPLKEDLFDLIVSTWVIEHLSNPKVFFREAFRVLQDKGTLVCSVPFIHRKHGSPGDWWRLSDTALSYLSGTAGFSEVQIQPVGGTPCIACLSLLWPFLRLPLMGFFLFVLAWGIDALIGLSCKITGKGRELIESYPISYIVVAKK